jgi:hypothetical protein
MVALALGAASARAEWTCWSPGPGGGPACWDDGRSLAFVTPLPEGPTLVACRWDGSGARALTGPRSRLPKLLVRADDGVETDRTGGLALVGDRLLVSLVGTGYVDLPSAAGLPPDSAVRDAALSGDGRIVALVDPDGRLLMAPIGLPLRFSSVAPCPQFRKLQLDGGGKRCLLSGDGKARVIDLATGGSLCEVPADAAALTGDGRRLAYAASGELRRRDIDDATETAVSLGAIAGRQQPAVWGMAAADWGRRVVVGFGASLWESSWTGDELRPLAVCTPGAQFDVSENGVVVAFSSGGLVHVASYELPEPPLLVPLTVPYARGPDAAAALQSLAELIGGASAGAETGVGGLTARDPDTGWALYRHEAPPFTVRVPPNWSVAATDAGVRLSNDRGCSVDVIANAIGDEDPRAALERMTGALGLTSEPRSGLLGGVPAVTLRGTLTDGRCAAVWCARWSGGLVTVEAEWPGGDLPADLLEAVESLALEPWALEATEP